MSVIDGQCKYGNSFLIPNENAVNPCYLELFILFTGIILLPFGLFQLWSLIRKESYGKIRYNKIGAVGLLRIIGVTAQGILFAQSKQLIYTSNSILIFLIALPLTYIELFKSPISTGSLIFYWAFQGLSLLIAAIQSKFSEFKISGDYVVLYIGLANSIHLFLSSALFYKPVHEVLKAYMDTDVVQANILSRMTFYWMNPLIAKGYRNETITDADLPNPPAQLDPKYRYERLKEVWESQKSDSLLLALMKVSGLQVLAAISYECVNDVLSLAEPQLLRILIKFFDEEKPYIYGFLVAFGLFASSITETALTNKFFISIYEVDLGTKSSLMTLIYHKALKLSPESKKNRTTGDIINHMSVDVSRIQDLSSYFQMIVGTPVKLVLVLASLYQILGVSTIAGIITMAIMIPINTSVSKRLKKLHKTQMKYKDDRTRVTSELLTSIKSIKLYAIEEAILEKLDYVRNVLELGNLKKISIFQAFMTFSWNCVPFFVSCSSFTMFALIEDKPLSPDIVFPSLALFNLLSEPIYLIPQIITAIIEVSVAFDRLRSFLLCHELSDDLIEHFDKVDRQGDVAVKVTNATFYWEEPKPKEENYDEESTVAESKVALTLDSFEAKKAELTCIVGRVGAGKSTFLQSLLGQLPVSGIDGKPPSLKVHGDIAYCAQVPWIMNASVKDNILFGHKFDESFYQKTIDACQLLPDLEVLPDGDETQVGEKGISLSGGQKARLSLARAVYARADVYLLDDVLSAVDAHVGRNIITKVINGLLATKTIILATNSIPVLNYAANIILLTNGKIVESGSFKDVMGTESQLSTLLNEFGANFELSAAEAEAEEAKIEAERRGSITTLRRASVASFTKVKRNEKSKRTAQQEEKSAEGKVAFRVYKEYAKACGLFGVSGFILFLILGALFSILGNYSLKNWSENNEKNKANKDVFKYVGIYAFFGIGSGVFTLARTIVLWVFSALRGSRILHNRMARAVVRSPMSFFETTPIGRVINRFSTDINRVDEGLPRVFSMLFNNSIRVLFTLALIGATMPSFILIVAVLSVLYVYYQRYYIGTSRDLKRIVNVSRSPIFAHLQESLTGYETIRAYQQEPRFQFIHLNNLAINLRSLYVFRSINRWLAVRLQFIGSVIIFATASLAILHNLTPGMAGLVISYALQITTSLSFIVRMTVEAETQIVSVERVLDYCDLKPEAEEITDSRPPTHWPQEGAVNFDHYSTRYRENLDLVLNDVTLDIKPREKIGIVGRTGAGKSTLSLALFRLIEPASGKILIDSVNTSEIGLKDLRGNLAIIPQDSQAFEGTVRQNLDPLGEQTDEELWKVLELSHLKSFIQGLDKDKEDGERGLEAKVSEGGSNFSVGQRQLLCLARALLNPSKVLVLDEATASVDVETDQIVQKTIREAFNDRTILTIAHRIDTVLDSDKIVVLDKGQVKEFDSPQRLLEDKESLFYKLCEQGGYIESDN
ncbi:Multidrug resistance-associated protein 1 [Wickerhamomyces ciferrii]|uniref:Multidrug resistance-associated protein 1 n=1 Tax=Wickerhamomyces ciferrii (strain ATCC 14091 / BCRC 22168 / CBS 111 / JCM 3599 / NBRC 0793 / NRRL Y-1031 F-60-10) TaxID=1206466 RepID=K0KJ21_WICCF|nr:Multidrug resistance-associated protein 1 [Wickerhamomyces ciferrii]CCH41464.1 Multidrug resistance-associated protein 1 [Wickerhamomyces ciferrii]